MIFSKTILLLLPLALANPHILPARRRYHHGREFAGAAFNDTADDTPDAVTSTTSTLATSQVSTAALTSATSALVSTTVSSATVDSATTDSATTDPATSSVDTTIPTISSTSTQDDDTISATSVVVVSQVAPVSSIVPVASTNTNAAPLTLSAVATSAQPSTLVVTHSSINLVTTVKKTASSTSSATSAASHSSSSGINRPTLIAIIAVASVVVLAAAAFTAFRKWKLKPSNRFDSRMKPIDFSPHKDGLGDDDFLEKTLVRSNSRNSLERQRHLLVSQLDAPGDTVHGVPEHDFTAGTNGAGYGAGGQDMYNRDPYNHAEDFDYDAAYQYQSHVQYPPAAAHYDHPTQDEPTNEGYADLQRGNSVGSGSGHGHGQSYHAQDTMFPDPNNYLGRPTGSSEGPYAQAATYRGY